MLNLVKAETEIIEFPFLQPACENDFYGTKC